MLITLIIEALPQILSKSRVCFLGVKTTKRFQTGKQNLNTYDLFCQRVSHVHLYKLFPYEMSFYIAVKQMLINNSQEYRISLLRI